MVRSHCYGVGIKGELKVRHLSKQSLCLYWITPTTTIVSEMAWVMIATGRWHAMDHIIIWSLSHS